LTLFQEILTAISLVIMITLFYLSFREMRRAQNRIPSLDKFVQFERGENGETTVVMDERLVAVFKAFGSNVAQSLKMSFLQGLGAQAKVEKGLQSAIAQDIVEEKMPLLNLVGDFLGFNTKQYIAKHPAAIGQIAQLAAPLLGQFTGQNQRNNSPGNVPTM
jgi:hypothetical protein